MYLFHYNTLNKMENIQICINISVCFKKMFKPIALNILSINVLIGSGFSKKCIKCEKSLKMIDNIEKKLFAFILQSGKTLFLKK